jgi:Protein of unknown function (DUF3006)
MQYVIDRIENGWATLEDESATVFTVPANWLPPEAREGDVLRMTVEPSPGSCTVRSTLDPAAREEQQKKARELRDKLPRGPKGDITL